MRLAVCQTYPRFADVAANLHTIEHLLERHPADLSIFPECAFSGYGFDSRAAANRAAVSLDGPEIGRIRDALRKSGGRAALVGLLEASGERLFNAAVLVTQDGVLGVYRKSHLLHLGVDRFDDPGDLGLPVFELDGARIGVLICFEFSLPEPARVLKLRGAQLICVPTNWPEKAEISCDFAPRVRAQENHVFVATCDRVGEEAGFRFRGRSRILDPEGRVLAEADAVAEQVLEIELDLAAADHNRVVYERGGYELDRIGVRRPDLYREIVEPRADSNGR